MKLILSFLVDFVAVEVAEVVGEEGPVGYYVVFGEFVEAFAGGAELEIDHVGLLEFEDDVLGYYGVEVFYYHVENIVD